MKNRSKDLRNKIKRLYTFIRKILKKYRKWLDKQRLKNPKLNDGIQTSITFFWFVFSTCFVNLQKNVLFVTIMMFVTFWGLYISQWAVLTNKLERKVNEEKTRQEQKISFGQRTHEQELKNIYDREFNYICFVHLVAHNIKMQVAQMENQKLAVTRTQMTKFLSDVLNTMEDYLTEYYGQDVRASIKFCYGVDSIKTYVRGQKNTSSRGGIAKVKALNKKDIKISDNYAYKAIIRNERQYFSEGDLHNLNEKEKDYDSFYCEYKCNWPDIFNASIIIPIRYPNMSGSGVKQNVLGLICIDALNQIDEWSNPDNCYAYHMTAFLADILYDLTDQYIKMQQMD